MFVCVMADDEEDDNIFRRVRSVTFSYSLMISRSSTNDMRDRNGLLCIPCQCGLPFSKTMHTTMDTHDICKQYPIY